MTDGLLLDTCAWLDLFTAPERLIATARGLVRKQSVLHLASISLLEVARKEALGQLSLAVPLAE